MIKRELEESLLNAAKVFPVIALLGPRQSGKTTLAQNAFAKHKYISLEDLDMRELASQDPRRFLEDYPNESGLILDEIQHVPGLLSYIQTMVDKEKKKGFFILTGSQNILVSQAISQSLAGRIAILTLLPLSLAELQVAQKLPGKIEDLIFKGFYPAVHAENIGPNLLYANYIASYVEKDVRSILNVSNLSTFQRFLQLCAGRVGQLLNLTSLGNDCGIDHKTARAWLSVLEASYIVFTLYPYAKNLNKRVIKSPKLYFTDPGLACALLKIKSADQIAEHYLRGELIENLIITDFFKQYYNANVVPSFYFWRDQQGHEVDCIIEEALHVAPVEIKASKTITRSFFENLVYWQNLNPAYQQLPKFLIYGGADHQPWPDGQVLGWQEAGRFMQKYVWKQS